MNAERVGRRLELRSRQLTSPPSKDMNSCLVPAHSSLLEQRVTRVCFPPRMMLRVIQGVVLYPLLRHLRQVVVGRPTICKLRLQLLSPC